MPSRPMYCSQCGQKVTTRTVGDRERVICPACDIIFYENPLPVAASIVFNDRREVLLIKRGNQPHKGEWCLPMGFAELGETIAEAAMRELREEAGVEGRVVRLIDSESFDSHHYGDLLIVTFEIEKTGGTEVAGDDADAVRYFPIGHHPPLAFSANEKALRLCVAAHLEAWEIEDSFETLEHERDKSMLSDDLVALVQDRADEVARLWLADVQSNHTTRSYQSMDCAELTRNASVAIGQLGRWLRGDAESKELMAFYRTLAQERKDQGLRFQELLSALTLLKKHVWASARAQGVGRRTIDMYRLLELNRRVAVFFDKATYHAAKGFEGRASDR